LNNNPAAKRISKRSFSRASPGQFISDDIHGDYERIKTRGAEFTMRHRRDRLDDLRCLNDTCAATFIQLTH